MRAVLPSINMVDTVWKSKLRTQFPELEEHFMADLDTIDLYPHAFSMFLMTF